jgi:hypothetical protein
VQQDIIERASQRNPIKLMTDLYNAKKLAEELLNNEGLPVAYFRQGYLSLYDATKTLHELIIARLGRAGDSSPAPRGRRGGPLRPDLSDRPNCSVSRLHSRSYGRRS